MTPRILRTTRNLPTEIWELEPFEGMDGQGLPAYGSPVEFLANVLEYDVRQEPAFTLGGDGSAEPFPLTLFVQGDSAVVPKEQDRVSGADDRTFIVRRKKTVHGLRRKRSEPDHFRLGCREEGA